MTSAEVLLTLDDAVAEVLGMLTGLDLTYDPEQDRYRSIARQLNRALRSNALENEWSCYASTQSLGRAGENTDSVYLSPEIRPRIISDDAVRLVNGEGRPVVWAYFLPRDAIHKYAWKKKLWCSVIGSVLQFNRPLTAPEGELEIVLPVMREPRMFRLPPTGDEVPDYVRNQEVDFQYPDLIIARAAYYCAMADPVMQPRAQTLEQEYKGLMYQLIERDTMHTDTPYMNEFLLPLENGLRNQDSSHLHPHANW